MKILRPLLIGAALLIAGPAWSQAPVCFKTSSSQIGCTPVTTTTSPLPVTGTFTPSASSPEFTPVAPATATATNGVLLGGQYDSTQKTLTNGQQAAYSASPRGALYVGVGAEAFTVQPGNTANTTPWLTTLNPSSASGAAVTPAANTAVSTSQVIKASAGNLYSLNVSADSTLSGAAWWVMIHNAAAAPAAGAVTPLKCYALASGTTMLALAFNTPVRFGTGISVTVSTTGCFTQTDSAHAFISGDAS